MAIIRRKSSNKLALVDYVKATDAISRPLAIVVVLIMLSILAAILLGLYWGGDWVYNRYIKDNNNTVQVDDADVIGSPVPAPSTSAPKPTPTPTPIKTPTPTPLPNTGTLPNTGPLPE